MADKVPIAESKRRKAIKYLSRMDLALQVAQLGHFLLFLVQGKYRSLAERVLRIQAGHNEQPTLEEIDFESMNRELLWHGFADALIFLLPLINFRKLWNSVGKKAKRAERKVLVDTRDVGMCAVCQEFAVLPEHGGCGHVFCYYCLKANLLSDPGFCCPMCGVLIVDDNEVHEAK